MQLLLCLLIFQFMILCNQYDFTNAKALIGTNIRKVNENEFPFVVCIIELTKKNSNINKNVVCTGTLISSKDVLTAEHCLENIKQKDLQIIVGANDLRFGKIYHPAWWISYNEWALEKNKFIEFKINDILIIRLTEDVPNDIHIANLSILKSTDLHGSDVVVTGWGVSNYGQSSTALQAVNVKILSNIECENRVSKIQGQKIPFHIRLLCTAVEPYAFLEWGDSGGPVIYKNTIVAINQGTCPLPELPLNPEKVNVHLGIDYYRDFILDVINNYRKI